MLDLLRCRWIALTLILLQGAIGFPVAKLAQLTTTRPELTLFVKNDRLSTFSPFQSIDSPSHSSNVGLSSVNNDLIDVDQRSIKQDFIKSLAWMGAATGFAALLGALRGPAAAIEFSSGYILELCLSVDNLFVFLVLFDYFKVSGKAQEKVLSYGIFGAVVLRGLFIIMGSVAIHQFHQVLLLFSAVLAYSSFKILIKDEDNEEEEDPSNNPLIKFSQEFFHTSPEFDGDKFFTVKNGVKLATPLFICAVCIELSDILFAFDSVPAIFGVTQDPVVVYTSNIFAIAGLRSLYAILSKAVSELKYLEKAVGLVLGVIAVKLGYETFGVEILTPLESLLVVLGIIGLGITASLWGNDDNSDGAGQ
eukprot:gene32658-39483_t